MSSVLWPLCYDDDSGGSLDDDDYEAANKSVSFNLNTQNRKNSLCMMHHNIFQCLNLVPSKTVVYTYIQ